MNEEKKGEEEDEDEETSEVEEPDDEILENQAEDGVVGVDDPLVESKLKEEVTHVVWFV